MRDLTVKFKLHSLIRLLQQHKLTFPLLFMLLSLTPDISSGSSEMSARSEDTITFLDSMITSRMKRYQLTGAAASYVRGDSILLLKGYPQSLREGTPGISPYSTLLPAGSVSKLVTCTAAMQMIEEGKLSLHSDVNRYLKDIRIPPAFSHPITLFHLMTHTAGLEHIGNRFYTEENREPPPLGDFLKSNLPARLFTPGEITCYSNYGIALAGYLVELASGTPFCRYVEERIFRPLEMHSSTFDQPSYAVRNEETAPGCRLRPTNMPPAGSMRTTARGMANFMIAHLQEGSFGNTRIMDHQTARQMQRLHFSNAPGSSGMALGFKKWIWKGTGVIGHDGSRDCFHSILLIQPEQGWGLFFFCSGGMGRAAINELKETFPDRFLSPGMSRSTRPPLHIPVQPGKYTGRYIHSTYPASGIRKYLNIIHPEITVNSTETGYLRVTTGEENESPLLAEVEPLVFRERDAERFIFFRSDREGDITHMFFGDQPVTSLIKLPWWETTFFHQILLFICTLVFISAVIIPIITHIKGGAPTGRGRCGTERFLCLITASLNLIFLIILNLPVLAGGSLYSSSAVLYPLFTIPMITTAMTAIHTSHLPRVWGEDNPTPAEKIHFSLFTLAGLLFIYSLIHWNLLGYNF